MIRRYGFIAVYFLVAAAIMAPLWLPGFILTLDLVFTPRLPLPDTVTNTYVLELVLHLLSRIIPAEIIEKCILTFTFIMAGVGMHRLVAYIQQSADTVTEKQRTVWKNGQAWGCYFAGLAYVVNPYTYSRFMAGQYLVLAGYALLPFFVRSCQRLLDEPSWQRLWPVVGWVTAIGLTSVHTLGIAGIIGVVALGVRLWQHRTRPALLRRVAGYGAAAVGITGILQSFWIIPALFGKGETGTAVNGFGAGDTAAFAVQGDNLWEQLFNVLSLRGFWAEGRALYELPHSLPLWNVALGAMWLLAGIGIVFCWRHHLRKVMAILLGSMCIAVLLALGGAGWLAGHITVVGGFREPHKFVAIIALGVSICSGLGVAWIAQCAARFTTYRETIALFLLVPILFGGTLWWGGNGQLHPRHYPPDWYAVDAYLKSHSDSALTLFLPWHLYMHYSFADRIIASPAEKFFAPAVITSNEMELGTASPATPDTKKTQLTDEILPNARQGKELGKRLAPLGIRYVMLAKEGDAWRYAYLHDQEDLELVRDTPTLLLYKNTAYKEVP